MPRSLRTFPPRMLLLLALIAIFATPFAPTAAAQGSAKINIAILPINKARFVPGQRFDCRVEVSGDIADNTDPGSFTVMINGKPASQVLGKEPEKTNSTPRSAELTWRQVSLNAAGSYSVVVSAGSAAKTVTWEALKLSTNGKPAKNIILFVGDGMAWQMLTMARVVSKGLTEGKYNGYLNMDQMDEVGYVTTSGYDALVTDSANSASAYATGHKSVVNAMGVYEDNTPSPFDDPKVENVVELLQRVRGMSIGLVTTSEIEDATPAAMFTHTRRRAEKQAVADSLLESGHMPEVIMGGGAAYFIPKSSAGSKRKDERDLLAEFRTAGYSVAGTRTEMNAAANSNRLLGLFHPSDMNVWIDREYTKDPSVLGPYTDQPALYEMTQKAINVLSKDKDGFFLLVEGASIDKQLHPMDWERAVADTIEFDKALGVAKA
ncbi:MAG: alkaline phosphatase, partial [Oscillochloris sp.]|nr:alkaline phosphatase [Oscillochloris sp.]